MTQPLPPEFSRRIAVSALGDGAERFKAAADDAERAALAKRYDAEAVTSLSYDLEVAPWRDGRRVTGTARAVLTRTCVVTLEPVEERVTEEVDRTFSPAAGDAETRPEDKEFAGDDPPDPLGAALDLGEIAAEAVALGLDPYPRKDGAVFTGRIAAPGDADPMTEETRRPFAGLSALRDKLTGGG